MTKVVIQDNIDETIFISSSQEEAFKTILSRFCIKGRYKKILVSALPEWKNKHFVKE
jgi:hypothetical protein